MSKSLKRLRDYRELLKVELLETVGILDRERLKERIDDLSVILEALEILEKGIEGRDND